MKNNAKLEFGIYLLLLFIYIRILSMAVAQHAQ